jgi:hypothetical protein
MKRIVAWVFVAGALGIAAVMVFPYLRSDPLTNVNYPYVCKDCKAVFSLEELRADNLKNCRIVPNGPSDSVVFCLRCKKGWAFPVKKCETCGTQHILYLSKDNRCPKCFPEAGEVARKEGVNVLFQQP